MQNGASLPPYTSAPPAGPDVITEPTATDSPEFFGQLSGMLPESVQSWLSGDRLWSFLSTYGPKVLAAVAVLIIGRWLAKLVTSMTERAARRARVDATLVSFLGNVQYLILLTVVCISALSCLGVNTTSLSAVLAAAGFAVGMAMQSSLGNLASGVMLVFFKPFKVGDFVEAADTSGTVAEIHIFNTILRTPDNIRVVVPNGNITNGTIRNFSSEGNRRIDLVVSCGYNDDLQGVKRFLEEMLKEDPRILPDPAPTVGVMELADFSVNFAVRPWVRSTDYWPTRFDLLEKIKLGMDERGYTIPFPSQDLFVHNSAA